MRYLFNNAWSFNQPLNNWNVSKVEDMSYMFQDATSFNQPLNNWNVSNVTFMNRMFNGARSFNQPLNNWNVSNVDPECLQTYMFEYAGVLRVTQSLGWRALLYFRLQALRICDASQASPRVSERSPSGPTGLEANVLASVPFLRKPAC